MNKLTADKSKVEFSSPDLAVVRRQIDELDAVIHNGLMTRAILIEKLIAAKRLSPQTRGEGNKAPFRPAREAAMMQKLYARHHGMIPFQTIEHIWREIIATFTYLQAPFRIILEDGDHIDMFETARFHFGFTPSIIAVESSEQAFSTACADDLIIVRDKAATPWWRHIQANTSQARQIIAKLPIFIRSEGRYSSSAYVAAPALVDKTAMDRSLFNLVLDPCDRVLVKDGIFPGDHLLDCLDQDKLWVMVATDKNISCQQLTKQLAAQGIHPQEIAACGFIQQFTDDCNKSSDKF